MNYGELITEAIKARENSYSPYSNYRVGAALLCADGTVVYGCNMENAAFTPGICGERTAIYKAVSEGKRDFRAIAIVAGPAGGELAAGAGPCGVCRQVMMEFCDPKTFEIILGVSPEEYQVYTLEELLPIGFGPSNLE